MDTPTNILRSAIFEVDDNQRIQKVIRACKIITDLMPFDKKNEILLEELEMMKYLLLSMPILLSSISMILESLYEKFKKNPKFVKNLWYAIEFIALLEENDQAESNNTNSARLNEGVIDDFNKSNYCVEIMRSKDMIKLVTLQFTEDISELVYRELHNKIDFIFDANGVLKRFIENTNNDRIIVKACSILEKIKAYDLASNIDSEIEELLLSKKNAILKNVNQEEETKDRIKPHSGNSGLYGRPDSNPNININNNNKDNENGGVNGGKKSMSTIVVKGKGKEKVTDIPKFKDFNLDDSIQDDEGDNDLQNVCAKIEDWLVRGNYEEIPLIGKNDYMMEAIKLQENFENLILFIADPQAYMISPIWANVYPELLIHNNKHQSQNINDSGMGKKLKKLEDESLTYYMFRSYKTMLVLTDLRNFKYITSVNKNAVEYYFGVISMALKKEDNMCNMNHMAKVAEYFIKREPNISINCILHCNLLYKFIQNIEFTHVQQLILTIFDRSDNFYSIGEENLKKVLKYCKYADFFDDFVGAMLIGEKHIEPIKLETDYKPYGYEEINSIHENPDNSYYSMQTDHTNDMKQSLASQSLIIEEMNGFKSDIDGIKKYIRQKSTLQSANVAKQTSVKTASSSKSVTNSRTNVSIDKMKNYPSLAEKIEKSKASRIDDTNKTVKEADDMSQIKMFQKLNSTSSISSFPKVDSIHSLSDSSLSKQLEEVSLELIGDTNKPDNANNLDNNKNKNKDNLLINDKEQNIIQQLKSVSSFGSMESIEKGQKLTKKESLDENSNKKKLTKSESISTQKITVIKQLDIGKIDHPNPKMKHSNSKVIQANTVSPDNKANPESEVQSNDQNSKILPKGAKFKQEANTTASSFTKARVGTSMSKQRNDKDQPKLTQIPRNIQTAPEKPGNIRKRATVADTAAKKGFEATMTIDNNNNNNNNNNEGDMSPNPLSSQQDREPIAAQSLLNRFLNDGTLTNKGIEQLSSLYPVSIKSLIETDVDKESRKVEFTPDHIKENDSYAFYCCEVLDVIIRKSLNNIHEANFRKLFGLPIADSTQYWAAIFESSRQKFFEILMKNYLFKIKIHHQMEVNSGYSAGSLVNLLLENISTNPNLQKYSAQIHKTSVQLLPFLCKVIINSHAWLNRKHIKVYLQTYTVEDPLGVSRLMLVTTLKLIIWNDSSNKYSIIYQVNDTCWHTLIIWFYEKKTNNMYNRMFYLILQKIFELGNEKLLITILFKLNLLSNISKIMNEICINGVLLKDNHIDSVVYHIACIMKLIKDAIKEKQKYPTLIEQLKASISWNNLKEEAVLAKINVRSVSKPTEKKSTIASKESTIVKRKSEMKKIINIFKK